MRQVLFYRSRGGGLLCGYRWVPDGAPKAIVQIVHGIADHASRYEEFAEFLNRRGFLVVAEDHMGHGDSITEEALQGYFNGGWFAGVEDTYQLYLDTRKKYPDTPYVLFGHSMGSFMARTILARYPDSGIDAVIICGTGWLNPVVLRGGRLTADMVCRKQGEKCYSELLQKLMFGTYNAKIENPRTDNDWISRDEDWVDAYNADPLCGFIPTAGLVREMLDGVIYIQDRKNLARMKKELPVLFIAGGDDPVGGYGQGVKQTVAQVRKAGMTNVSCRIYREGRHEILGEINREKVFTDVANWIKSVLMD